MRLQKFGKICNHAFSPAAILHSAADIRADFPVHLNKVIRKHALRNALIPIITVFGVQFSNVLGGSVLAETVFAWPGVGRLVVDAIDQRDIPMVTGALVMTTMIVSIVNLLIDIVYAFVDPRIKSQYTK